MGISHLLRNSRTEHIHWPPYWRRHPLLSAVAVLLLILAYVDHRGYVGWQGDDPTRYHSKVFTCIAVLDGDTIDVDVPDGRYTHTRIRMWGVDTPEVEGSGREPGYFGPQASQFAKQALRGKRVRLELAGGRTRDKYGRVLAYVFDEQTGDLFNAALIETGHGYADRRFDHPRMADFVRLEEQARLAKRGLWQHITKEGMPHWRRRLEE